MKCTACGSAALIAGTVHDSQGGAVAFYPSDLPSLKRIFYIGGKEVRAYGCTHCQNLQFAVDFSESDLERHQQFDGVQPDVLKRINSDPDQLED